MMIMNFVFLAVKMVTNKEEREVVELVEYILAHVLYSNSP